MCPGAGAPLWGRQALGGGRAERAGAGLLAGCWAAGGWEEGVGPRRAARRRTPRGYQLSGPPRGKEARTRGLPGGARRVPGVSVPLRAPGTVDARWGLADYDTAP